MNDPKNSSEVKLRGVLSLSYLIIYEIILIIRTNGFRKTIAIMDFKDV